MLTKQDKQFLKDNFATKKDLANELKPIKTDVRSIKKKLNTTIKLFDKQLNYHHRRLNQLEEHAGLKPPPYLVLSIAKN